MTPITTPSASLQILRIRQVCQMTGLCASSVYQLESEDRFPKRVHLSARAVGWVEGEIQGWLAERVAGRRR